MSEYVNNKRQQRWQPIMMVLCLALALFSTATVANNSWFKGNSGVSLESAITQVKTQHKGRVLSAATYTVNGKKQHHVKLLSTGRVKTYKIDAQSGKQLNKNQRRQTDAYPNNRR